MQKTVKMTLKEKNPGTGHVDRKVMNLKKKLTLGGILTLSCGYIHVYDLYSQTNLLVYTIGPLVLAFTTQKIISAFYQE